MDSLWPANKLEVFEYRACNGPHNFGLRGADRLEVGILDCLDNCSRLLDSFMVPPR